MNRELFAASLEVRASEAQLDSYIEAFGHYLGEKNGWGIDGMEAVTYHLMKKFHWTPAEIRAMRGDDIRLAVSEEWQDWHLPKDLGGFKIGVQFDSAKSESAPKPNVKKPHMASNAPQVFPGPG